MQMMSKMYVYTNAAHVSLIAASWFVRRALMRRATPTFEKLPHCQFDKVDKDPPFLKYFVCNTNPFFTISKHWV